MPKKIFEIKFGEWEKALSHETTSMVKGIFKQFSNCDPFEGRGSFSPTLYVNELGSGVISGTKTIRAILPVWATEGNQFYCLADDYKLYRIDSLPPVVDVSSQIASGTATAIDLATFKGGLVYAMSSEVRYNTIPVASGNDVQILNANPTSNFCIGADRYGYIGINNNVGKIISVTGTTGNTTTVATSLESNNTVRKLINDGYYLVWIAENTTQTAAGRGLITIGFWNMASSTFDQIYEFEGGAYAGAELVGDYIRILTSTGLYIVRFGEKPKKIIPFGGTVAITDIPTRFSKVTGIHKGNQMFWGTYQSSGNIFGYGNSAHGDPDRLFQMGTTSATAIMALASNNTKLIVATGQSSSVKLFDLRGSSTYNTAIANVAGLSLGRPFTFHSARVITKSPIASGNSVSLQILTANSTKTIKASETKTNSTDPGERCLIFDHTSAGDGSDVNSFDDISDIKLSTNVPINSIEIWGNPVSERGSYG